jgi:anti-sigma factor RsiW
MKDCWAEGDLRAYLDRELAPEEMERATAHLAECPECNEKFEAVSARAGRVSKFMDALAEPALPVLAAKRPARGNWRWAAAALAAAAAIVLAILVSPHPAPRTDRAIEATAPRIVQPAESAPVVHEAAVRTKLTPRRTGRPPANRTETFIALDSEPFEAGWVVRMALGPDQIPADVVFSADGRARGYRVVTDPRP